jgi:uncharacterized protein YkwD
MPPRLPPRRSRCYSAASPGARAASAERRPGVGAKLPGRPVNGALEDRLLRKLGAVLLALPVLLMVYVASIGQRGMRARIVSGIAAAAVIGLIVVASRPPAPSVAVPKSLPQPVSAELLDAVRTGHTLTDPFTIAFAAPMEPASVAAAVRIAPDAPVSFGWDAAGRVLTVAPVGHWMPDTMYTITVSDAARSADGAALASPVKALVLTGHGGAGTLAAARVSGDRVRLDTSFRIVFDRAVDLAALRSALRTEPKIGGEVVAGPSGNEFVFRPSGALAPNTTYRIWVDALDDVGGIPLTALPNLSVRTVTAPSVVRYRPRSGAADVARGAAVSIRFTDRMDHKATAGALRVTADGKPVTGKVTWAEGDTVMVFVPSSALPYGAKVVVAVGSAATSKAGVPLATAGPGSFKVVAKPAPKPKAAPRPKVHPPAKKPITKPIKHSGGGGAVSGSWSSVEAYYLELMNCTRTGGWVTSSGACSSPGGRNVAPLALSAGISAKVSRPYAKFLATRGLCNHFYDGNPGDRLRRAGYTSYRWGENIGCEDISPYKSVLGSHLFFQREKPYNGGHYRNLMNAEYDRAGIGVWVAGGHVRLVIDLYHP